MSDDCLFCKIITGAIPAVKVYESDDVLAFMDIMPAREGHTLIIPKVHSESLLDATPAAIAAVAKASIPIASAVKQAVNADGIRVMQFNGAPAGQTVFHYHMHIIPVKTGDGFIPHGREQAKVEDLQATAARIKAAL